jgi:hypothetical protein
MMIKVLQPRFFETIFQQIWRYDMSTSSSVSALRLVIATAMCAGVISNGNSAVFAHHQGQEKQTTTDGDAGKAKQHVQQLKKLKLIETLDMDQQTAEKFFMLYNTEQKKVDEALKALNETMQELSKASNQDPKKVSPDLVKQLTNQTLEKQTQMQTAVNERLRAIKSVLNDQQYAKFLLFEAKFQEEVRKTLLNMKRESKKEAESSVQKK